jgi:hypothetical protein
LSSHDTTYVLLAAWDLHRTSPESGLEAARKAAEVFGILSLPQAVERLLRAERPTRQGVYRDLPLLLGDLELLYEAVEELQGLVEGDEPHQVHREVLVEQKPHPWAASVRLSRSAA